MQIHEGCLGWTRRYLHNVSLLLVTENSQAAAPRRRENRFEFLGFGGIAVRIPESQTYTNSGAPIGPPISSHKAGEPPYERRSAVSTIVVFVFFMHFLVALLIFENYV